MNNFLVLVDKRTYECLVVSQFQPNCVGAQLHSHNLSGYFILPRTPTPACRILNLGEILVSSISQALDNDDNNFCGTIILKYSCPTQLRFAHQCERKILQTSNKWKVVLDIVQALVLVNHLASTRSLQPWNYVTISARVDNKHIQTSSFF